MELITKNLNSEFIRLLEPNHESFPFSSEQIKVSHIQEIDDLIQISKNLRKNQIEALQFALQAEELYYAKDEKGCANFSLKAQQMDPYCFDAYRVNYLLFRSITDGDTMICMLRELLSVARSFLMNWFRQQNGSCYSCVQLRPYLRILQNIGVIAMMSERYEISIYAFEEILRLDWTDHLNVCYMLLACYYKVIGKNHNGQETQIKRTPDHCRALLSFKNKESKEPLLDVSRAAENDGRDKGINALARWAPFFLNFVEGKKWRNSAISELNSSRWLMDSIIKSILANEDMRSPTTMYGSHIGSIYKLAQFAFADSPNFIILMRKLIKKKTNIKFNALCRRRAANNHSDNSNKHIEDLLAMAGRFLSDGRSKLKNGACRESIINFSICRLCLIGATYPKGRWYEIAQYPMITNRSLASFNMELWHLCRVDSIFSLVKRPDHNNTYKKLPIVADQIFSTKLKSEFTTISGSINDKDSEDQWRQRAKRTIALLSLDALICSRTDQLNGSKIDELEEVGIENLYAPLNLPSYEHPMLPWLQDEHLEINVV